MFKHLMVVVHKRYDGCGSNFARTYLQDIFYRIAKYFVFGPFIVARCGVLLIKPGPTIKIRHYPMYIYYYTVDVTCRILSKSIAY